MLLSSVAACHGFGCLRAPAPRCQLYSNRVENRAETGSVEGRERGFGTLPPMNDFKIESTAGIRDGIRILCLSGPFTLNGLFEFQSVVRGLSDPVVIIDLTNVPYMDSASVGAIVSVHTSAQRNNRHYALVGVCERILTLFDVLGLQGVLVTYPTLEEAQEKLGHGAATN